MNSDIERRLEAVRKEHDSRLFFNRKCSKAVKELTRQSDKETAKLATIDKAIKLVNDIAMSRRNEIKSSFEKVISDALRLLYEKAFSVDLSYDFKFRRNVLNILVGLNNGKTEVKRGVEGFGGGVWDTVATAFRILVISLVDDVDNFLWLDENFKQADREMILRVGELLSMIAKKMGMQIVFNTHHQELKRYADKVYNASITENGVSRLEVENGHK